MLSITLSIKTIIFNVGHLTPTDRTFYTYDFYIWENLNKNHYLKKC